jgi:predicted RNA-binding protein Jag
MKSIVEEASSIFKAVEKAWERAGKPADFSVKIFEDSQRSFFGLTKKQAKIGLFFDQPKSVESHEDTRRKKSEHKSSNELHSESRVYQGESEKKRAEPRERTTAPKSAPNIPHQRSTAAVPAATTATAVDQEKKRRSEWTPEMLKTVESWVTTIIQKSDLQAVPCVVVHQGNRLQITFEKLLFDDQAKNTALFRNLSYLLLGMVRSRYKKEFRFLKIVLTTQGQQSGDDLF